MTNVKWGFTLIALSAAAASVELPPIRSVASVGGAYGIHGRPDEVQPVGDWCEECTPGGVPLFPSKPGYVGDGRIFTICGACGGTQKRKQGDEGCVGLDEPEACQIAPEEPTEPIEDDPVIERMSGPRWTFENRGTNPSPAFKAAHLASAHGIDATGLTSEEMSAVHDAAHNYGNRTAASMVAGEDCPSGSCPTGSRASASSSCPSGSCPTSSSRSVRRRGLFGRWR